MLEHYFPILIFLLAGIGTGVVLLAVGLILGKLMAMIARTVKNNPPMNVALRPLKTHA